MKVRDFSRLEYRYAGLTGLFLMLRSTLIGYAMLIFLLALFAFLSVVLVGATFLVPDKNTDNSSAGLIIAAILVFLLGCFFLIFLIERVIVGVLRLKRVYAVILFLIFFVLLLPMTWATAQNIRIFHEVSLPSVMVVFLCFLVYIIFALFVCSQLLQVASIRSATERRILASPPPSLFSWGGLRRLIGLPPTYVHIRRAKKRIFLLMALSTLCFATIPVVATSGPTYMMGRFTSDFVTAQNIKTELATGNFNEERIRVYFSQIEHCVRDLQRRPNLKEELESAARHGTDDVIKVLFTDCYDDAAKDRLLAMIAFTPLIVFGVTYIGVLLRRLGHRMLAQSQREIAKYDQRQPVLFLRAFEDDQIKLPETERSFMAKVLNFGRPSESIDTLLLEEGATLGPVVALGNPEDQGATPFGAVRYYKSDESWIQAVEDFMVQARAVVLVLENADGVWFEVQRLLAYGYLEKTLFIIHPRYSSSMEYGLVLDQLLRIAQSCGVNKLDALEHLKKRKRKRRLLGFHFSSRGALRVYESREFSWISALLLMRVFFRSSRFDSNYSVTANSAGSYRV